MSNASTVEGRATLPTSVLKKRTKSWKTSDNLNDLLVDRLTWTVTLSPSEKKSVPALLDSGSEANARNPAYATELELLIRKTELELRRLTVPL